MRLKVSREGMPALQVIENATAVSFEGLDGRIEICINAQGGKPVILIRSDDRGYAIRPLPRREGIVVRCSSLTNPSGRHEFTGHPILQSGEWTAEEPTIEQAHDEAGYRTTIRLPAN